MLSSCSSSHRVALVRALEADEVNSAMWFPLGPRPVLGHTGCLFDITICNAESWLRGMRRCGMLRMATSAPPEGTEWGSEGTN